MESGTPDPAVVAPLGTSDARPRATPSSSPDRVSSSSPLPGAQEPEALREQLAALAHEQWTGWMRYLFSKLYVLPNLGVDPQGYRMRQIEADRWLRQMQTPYAELREDEKESDRKEADRVLAILSALPGDRGGDPRTERAGRRALVRACPDTGRRRCRDRAQAFR